MYPTGSELPSGCLNSYPNNCNYTSNITIQDHTYLFQNYVFSETMNSFQLNRFCYDNQTLPEDVSSLEICMPDDYFVWGFSSLLLYIIFALQLVWTSGMLLVWLHANMTSELLFKARNIRGNYRAVADLAEPMKDILGDECCAYSDREMSQELIREGHALRYCTTDWGDSGLSHIGLAKHGKVVLGHSRLYGARRRRNDD